MQPLYVLLLQLHAPPNADCDQSESDDEPEHAKRHEVGWSEALEETWRAKAIVSNLIFRSIVFLGFLESEHFYDALFNTDIVEEFTKSDSFELLKEEAQPLGVANLPHANED